MQTYTEVGTAPVRARETCVGAGGDRPGDLRGAFLVTITPTEAQQ